MARYYFYTADMFYEYKETPGAEKHHPGRSEGQRLLPHHAVQQRHLVRRFRAMI